MRNLYWAKRKADILQLLRQLKARDDLVYAYLYGSFIKVRFKDGIVEYWYYRPRPNHPPKRHRSFVLPKRPPFIRFNIQTFNEYETKPFEDERNKTLKPFFIVQGKDLKKAGFCDIRFKVHSLVNDLMNEGWIEPKYPPEILKAELAKIKEVPISNKLLLENKWQKCGFYNIVHFMPVAQYKVNGRYEEFSLNMLWRRFLLYKTLNALIRGKRDITRSIILKKITRILSRTYLKIASPLFFRAFYEIYLPVKGQAVLDMTPSWGTRALATIACGGDYYHLPNYIFGRNLNNMATFAGKPVNIDDGARRYHLTLVNDFSPIDVGILINRIKMAKLRSDNVVAFFRKDSSKVIHDLKPKQIIDLRNREKYLVVF